MRKLPAAAQEERRRQVIGLRQGGMTYAAIAAQVGLARTGVFAICKRFALHGAKGLASGKRGRRPDQQRLLDAAQEAEMRRLICRRTPDALGPPFALWSRAAAAALIEQRCRVRLAGRTAGKYLARWGFTAQKPLRRACEQPLRCHSTRCRARNLRQLRPAELRRWLRQDYPAILAQARRQKGVIFWGDETGLRSDDVRGRSCAPRGRTPLVRVCHKRAGLSLISAVTNRGELRWMAMEGAVNAPRLIRFLRRLIQEARRKVLLILDRLPVHRGGQVRDWLAAHRGKIEVFRLPPYSPELNPDEGLNADLKQAVTRNAPARSKSQLKRATISHMRRPSKLPARVQSYFRHNPVRYAA